MSVLMLESVDPDAMAAIGQEHRLILAPTPDALAHGLDLDAVRGIVTRGRGRVDRALLDACPALRAVARCGVGVDNIDLAAAAARGVPVLYAPGSNAAAVAEQAVMLMLMTLRRGFAMAAAAKAGDWGARSGFDGDDLGGSHVCIVGPGAVGRRTGELVAAFGARVNACSRGGRGIAGLRAALDDALPQADIVSLHLPLTDETRTLFDRQTIGRMKPGAILINTARGELLDRAALLDALESGALSAYGADVAHDEPPEPGDPVIGHPNAVVTPHVASLTRRTYREMSLTTARNLLAVLRGGMPEVRAVHPGGAPVPRPPAGRQA